jgi:hypothetical protein
VSHANHETKDVPALAQVAINGVPYLMDVGRYQRQTLEIIRQQADTSQQVSAASLNPNDLWRRFQDDWASGAGQRFVDFRDSDPDRFWRSLGVDVWERGQLTLLDGTEILFAGTATDTYDSATDTYDSDVDAYDVLQRFRNMVTADGYLWVVTADDRVLRYDGVDFTASAAVPSGEEVTSIATDGGNVYIATQDSSGDGGVYAIRPGTLTNDLISPLGADVIGFEKGRLLAAVGPDVYDISGESGGAPPDPIPALVPDEFRWTAFGSGPAYIYVAGGTEERTSIFRVRLREDATALEALVEVAQVPRGEHVHVMTPYLQLLLLGTSKGVRLALPSGDSLAVGPLIETDAPVLDMDPSGRYVWFTWPRIDSDETGLGRLDLAHFTDELTPAYAADISLPGQGTPYGVTRFDGELHFAIDDVGIVRQNVGVPRSSGYLEVGKVTYGLPDDKVFRTFQVRREGVGVVRARIWLDGAEDPALDRTCPSGNKGPLWVIDEGRGERALIRLDLSQNPLVTRWMLRALPTPGRTDAMALPLDLRQTVLDLRGSERNYDVRSEVERLREMVEGGDPVTVQVFGETLTCTFDQLQEGPGLKMDRDKTYMEGVYTAVLRTLDE